MESSGTEVCCGHVLEHVESSGTKVFMNGPVLYASYVWDGTGKQTKIDP